MKSLVALRESGDILETRGKRGFPAYGEMMEKISEGENNLRGSRRMEQEIYLVYDYIRVLDWRETERE